MNLSRSSAYSAEPKGRGALEPFVSIVVRTLNCREALERCLRSIRELHYPEERYEILVVDGGSQDGTVATARRYGAQVVFDNGKGRNAALNVGIEHARGQYVAFTDADCVVGSDWLWKAFHCFNDKLVVAVGGPNVVPKDGSPIARAFEVVNKFFVREPRKIAAVNFLATCNCIYKADVLRLLYPVPEIGGGEDAILGSRARSRGFILIYAPSVFVRNYTHYGDPIGFFKQAMTYGKNRLQLARYDKCFRSPLLWVWGFGPPALVLASTLLLILRLKALAALLAFAILVLLAVSARAYRLTKSLLISCYMPLVVGLLTMGYSFGFIREFLRLRSQISIARTPPA